MDIFEATYSVETALGDIPASEALASISDTLNIAYYFDIDYIWKQVTGGQLIYQYARLALIMREYDVLNYEYLHYPLQAGNNYLCWGLDLVYQAVEPTPLHIAFASIMPYTEIIWRYDAPNWTQMTDPNTEVLPAEVFAFRITQDCVLEYQGMAWQMLTGLNYIGWCIPYPLYHSA